MKRIFNLFQRHSPVMCARTYTYTRTNTCIQTHTIHTHKRKFMTYAHSNIDRHIHTYVYMYSMVLSIRTFSVLKYFCLLISEILELHLIVRI